LRQVGHFINIKTDALVYRTKQYSLLCASFGSQNY